MNNNTSNEIKRDDECTSKNTSKEGTNNLASKVIKVSLLYLTITVVLIVALAVVYEGLK